MDYLGVFYALLASLPFKVSPAFGVFLILKFRQRARFFFYEQSYLPLVVEEGE